MTLVYGQKKVFTVGPRKICELNRCAVVYLGKDFLYLVGKKALVTVEILDNPS